MPIRRILKLSGNLQYYKVAKGGYDVCRKNSFAALLSALALTGANAAASKTSPLATGFRDVPVAGRPNAEDSDKAHVWTKEKGAPIKLRIDAAKRGAVCPKTIYGIFFEDINYAADGGIYPELLANRGFDWQTKELEGWERDARGDGMARITRQNGKPVHEATATHLRIEAFGAGAGVGVRNRGFHGIHVEKGKSYDLLLYVRGLDGYCGNVRAVFAAMPGCRKAAWFHEGANCWLQGTMERERRHNEADYDAGDFGWLGTCSVMAPFLPIECYSGWLTDGTFGGPGAQGVCGEAGRGNVRCLFGGVQYSEVFPTFLGYAVDRKAVPWVWMNATGYVLEGLAKGLGKAQTERLILEYRSRLCLCDFGNHSLAVQRMYKNNLGKTLGSESWSRPETLWKATPYQLTTLDGNGWLVPDPLTTPGWSGANIIPIKVEGSSLAVSFKPHGMLSSDANMCCQLCYRTTDGETVYSEPFRTGRFNLDLTNHGMPHRGIVFAVVCNLDYAYTDNEDIRKNHYDYRLKIESRASTADVYADWFDFKVAKSSDGAR